VFSSKFAFAFRNPICLLLGDVASLPKNENDKNVSLFSVVICVALSELI
jgi:hypothetical protein